MSRSSTAVRVVNSRTPEQWAAEILEDVHDGVKGIFATAMKIEASHEELGPPAWLKMVAENLRWSKASAYKLLTIAQDEKLAEVSHVRLPPSWGTLYALAKLTPDQFQAGLDNGVIHAGMERKDIKILKPPKEKLVSKPAKREAPKSVLPPDEAVLDEVYSIVVSVLPGLDEERKSDFFARLRATVDAMEQAAQPVEEHGQ